METEMAMNMMKGLVGAAVREYFEETGRRPGAQAIIDWRQNFIVTDQETSKMTHQISHHFPFDPKVGEIWKISSWGYGGPGSPAEEQLTVEVDQVEYEWDPDRYENGHLQGWFLEINIYCHLAGEA